MRKLSRLLVIVVGLLVLAELAVQGSGVIDFPIYLADSKIGYIPAPSQHGWYLHSHEFQFNEYSMGAGPFKPANGRFNLLLVGDSIVLGGNPLALSDRLGPRLQAETGWNVWPISAGSWALQNELEYLFEHHDVVNSVDAVAIVSNSGDFDEPSSWATELWHPTHRPFPGLVYVIRKYLLPIHPPAISPQLRVAPRDWRADLRSFASTSTRPLYIFLYPDQEEEGNAAIRAKRLEIYEAEILAAIGDKGRIFRIGESPFWNTGLYRDAIHPSAQGNAVLARIIASSIRPDRLSSKSGPLSIAMLQPMD